MVLIVASVTIMLLCALFSFACIKLRDECENLIKENDEFFAENNELREILKSSSKAKTHDVGQGTLLEMFQQISEFADPNRKINISLCEELSSKLKGGERIKFKFYDKEPDFARINRICGNIPHLFYKCNRMDTSGAQFVLELELVKSERKKEN